MRIAKAFQSPRSRNTNIIEQRWVSGDVPQCIFCYIRLAQVSQPLVRRYTVIDVNRRSAAISNRIAIASCVAPKCPNPSAADTRVGALTAGSAAMVFTVAAWVPL